MRLGGRRLEDKQQLVVYEMAAQFNWLAVSDEAILQLFGRGAVNGGCFLPLGESNEGGKEPGWRTTNR
jgi:hypothetical protein